MSKHLFNAGQMVDVIPSAATQAFALDMGDDSVQIVRLLPAADVCFRYLVRNRSSGKERICGETDLRVTAKAPAAAR
ncbi:MAG: hypothetical protein ACXWNN_12765 [Candidatus Binataceae bacterium]